MTAVRARGRLLTADEAGVLLGAGPDRVTFLEDCGFIGAVMTGRGPCYSESELLVLRNAILPPPARLSQKITVAQAAYILGVSAPTVRRAVREGVLTVDGQGLLGPGEVRALHKARRGRKPLRPAPPETTGEDG